MKKTIYLLSLIMFSTLVLAANYDYTNGTINTVINLTENELTTLQISESLKIKIVPYVNTTLIINEIGERNYTNPPTTVWNNTFKEAIILEGFLIDIEENNNFGLSILLDSTKLNTTSLLLDTVSGYSFMMNNWFKIPSHTTEFHFEASWKNFVVAGYNPIVVVEKYECDLSGFNLSCPSIDYSMINYTIPEINYSLITFPEPVCHGANLSCPQISCPSVSCPLITTEEKQSIAELITSLLVIDIQEDTAIPIRVTGEEDEVKARTIGLSESEETQYQEDKERFYDYIWYFIIGFGLILLILIIIKKVRQPKDEERIEYLEVE